MAEESYKVTLKVHDLSNGMARQLSTTLLGKAIDGIWHTNVVVYGMEYYFSGGIQQVPAGTAPYGTPVKVVDLGVTHVPQDVFEMYLQEISPRYTAETYSLLTHNCNNFSNEVVQFLVGANIPEYILQLPNQVLSSPMGALIMPMIQNLETTMKTGAVPQVPQFLPTPVARPSSTTQTAVKEAGNKAKTENPSTSSLSPAVKPTEKKDGTAKGIFGDPIGDARSKVQEEITREFAAIMATGTLRASEAAAIATKRVMQRYGNTSVTAQNS